MRQYTPKELLEHIEVEGGVGAFFSYTDNLFKYDVSQKLKNLYTEAVLAHDCFVSELEKLEAELEDV